MELIADYIKTTNLVSHQMDTMNHFYNKTVRNIVVGSEISSQYMTTKFTDIKWELPKIGPIEAAIAYKTYTATLLVKLDKIKEYIPLCSIPVMVYSSLCIKPKEHGDPGGYFIIRGKERVLISYMRSLHDKIYTTQLLKGKYLYLAEIRNMSDVNSSVLTLVKCTKTGLVFSIPYIKIFIPGGVLLRCIDSSPDQVPLLNQTVFYDQTVFEYESMTKEEALQYIITEAGLAPDYVDNILKQHIKSNFYEGNYTVLQFGLFARKLDNILSGKISIQDKEELNNKRVDSPGMLMEYLFNGLFKIFLKSISYSIKSPNVDLAQMIVGKQVITNEIMTCFLTGNWVVKKKFGQSYTRMGMSQVLTNYNHPSRLSHLRKVMHNIGTKGKNYSVRQLHGSHMGMFCPFETPEGERVGLILNLAVTVEISVDIDPSPVLAMLKKSTLFINVNNINLETDIILLNGYLIGATENGPKLCDWLRALRSENKIDPKITISWDIKERILHILTDSGRLIRPLLDLSVKGPMPKTWAEAIRLNKIVFRSSDEISESLIAIDTKSITSQHKYSEIFIAATMTDIMAGLIPFANHTQSPRIIYQASMGKQAMGLPVISIKDRYDTTLNILDYPQKHLTRTCLAEPVLAHEFPSGAMPIVAICTMGGFNQEDSILLNKSSIERGLFNSTTYKTITLETTKRTKTETMCIPEDAIKRREYNYGYLNSDGIIDITKTRGNFLKKNTVILGKKILTETGQYMCSSIVLKSYEQGMLDDVRIITANSNMIIHIRIRLHRIPEIGDKFSSFTAQKGTCGMIIPQEDMPFDKNGLVPDLIINPHAFPSRMTINYLLQMCCDLFNCSSLPDKQYTKIATQDASMFQDEPIEIRLSNFLKHMGVDGFDSVMYSGTTGKKYPVKIFMAPCPYQRLKHLVSEKMYARVSGPLELLTRQPVAGRRRYGGLKTGEMERDCHISHGASMVLRESMFDKSDKYSVAICDDCEFGLMEISSEYCQKCGNTNIRIVNIPYTTKLLFQELQAVGIRLNIA
uniref:DNA-directed RNA polymerase subunit beta n=1 Tax=Rhinella marina erythrocytic-like virus TaxID=2859906 RepID=A0A8F6UAC0_9VIRU|nr:DNA-dependent RNA polymerase II second largest subunit [Rhinella marina erythrocytic-like virus]